MRHTSLEFPVMLPPLVKYKVIPKSLKGYTLPALVKPGEDNAFV